MTVYHLTFECPEGKGTVHVGLQVSGDSRTTISGTTMAYCGRCNRQHAWTAADARWVEGPYVNPHGPRIVGS